LTFLGEPRTKEAENAQETPWTMTTPLVVLSVFAIAYGWLGIPEDFMGLHLSPSWFHEFVGSTLTEHPEAVAFSWVPFATSLVVALGGLTLGYLYYRNMNSVRDDRLQIPLLKNKYYFDEAYDFLFVKPAYWFAENVVYKFLDKGVIDGILHLFGPATNGIGSIIRNYFDLPVINRFFGDGSANVTYWFGGRLRVIQTGRVQQYLMLALVTFIIIGAVLFFFVLA
jgi:NADH-quinone oxidoreductase subunit L